MERMGEEAHTREEYERSLSVEIHEDGDCLVEVSLMLM